MPLPIAETTSYRIPTQGRIDTSNIGAVEKFLVKFSKHVLCELQFKLLKILFTIHSRAPAENNYIFIAARFIISSDKAM